MSEEPLSLCDIFHFMPAGSIVFSGPKRNYRDNDITRSVFNALAVNDKHELIVLPVPAGVEDKCGFYCASLSSVIAAIEDARDNEAGSVQWDGNSELQSMFTYTEMKNVCWL